MFDRHKILEELCIGHQFDPGHIVRTASLDGCQRGPSERERSGDDRCNKQQYVCNITPTDFR
jgi:hypothetical protein